jgi:hypothetical protein
MSRLRDDEKDYEILQAYISKASPIGRLSFVCARRL